MNKKSLAVILLMQSAMVLMTGCQNYEPLVKAEFDDPFYKKGPGLFTGEDGYYEIDLDR